MSLSNTASLDHNNAPTSQIRKHRNRLLAIAEDMVGETKKMRTPENAIDATVEGNVRPSILVKMNPRGTAILDVIGVAKTHDLRVADVYQLDRDEESGIIRVRFKEERN